jgi:hypothetical protein
LDRSDLDLVEAAGLLLAVTGDERHRRPLAEEAKHGMYAGRR